VGDQGFVAKSEKRLAEMMGRSQILVLTSHTPDLILKTCDHCLWLEHGEVKAFGPAKDIVGQYRAAA
jgi:lipopolysaccharide transport system ATP-binding protein